MERLFNLSLKLFQLALYLLPALLLLVLMPLSAAHANDENEETSTRGFVVTSRLSDKQADALLNYKNSYALLIGVSDYESGWNDLVSIPGELDKLETVLRDTHGFTVRRVNNPNADELEAAYKDFVRDYGYDFGNRLLIYFAGHGFTRHDNKKGYLVPVDAPSPEQDEIGFLRRALDMTDMVGWAKKIEAKHVLFMFDSCFAGTIFSTRGGKTLPKHLSSKMAKPVRQFITAGSADEEVPSQSIFTPAFVDALEYGVEDYSDDGFLTGSELGAHMKNVVAQHSDLHVQSGVIKDYNLSQGDFIFTYTIKKERRLNATTTGDIEKDTRSPTIQHKPNATEIKMQGLEQRVSAVVTDNVAVQSVTLYYRVAGTKGYQSVAMNKSAGGDEYQAKLLPAEINPPGLEYYIQAKDGAGNAAMNGFSFSPIKIAVVDGSRLPGTTPDQHPPEQGADTLAGSEPTSKKEPPKAKSSSKKWWWIAAGVVVAAVAASSGGSSSSSGSDGGSNVGEPAGDLTVSVPIPNPDE